MIVLVSSASRGEHGGAAYRGLYKRSPFLALALVLALLSLAGVPPMSGFFAKFLILRALVNEQLMILAVIGALMVIVGLYFYFLWIKEIYFKDADEGAPTTIPIPASSRLVLWIGIVAMIAMGIFMWPFHEWAADAAKALAAVGG